MPVSVSDHLSVLLQPHVAETGAIQSGLLAHNQENKRYKCKISAFHGGSVLVGSAGMSLWELCPSFASCSGVYM